MSVDRSMFSKAELDMAFVLAGPNAAKIEKHLEILAAHKRENAAQAVASPAAPPPRPPVPRPISDAEWSRYRWHLTLRQIEIATASGANPDSVRAMLDGMMRLDTLLPSPQALTQARVDVATPVIETHARRPEDNTIVAAAVASLGMSFEELPDACVIAPSDLGAMNRVLGQGADRDMKIRFLRERLREKLAAVGVRK